MAVDIKDAPKEFLPNDLTAGGVLDDNEKPAEAVTAIVPTTIAQPMSITPQLPVTKEIREVDEDKELAKALAIVEEILHRGDSISA